MMPKFVSTALAFATAALLSASAASAAVLTFSDNATNFNGQYRGAGAAHAYTGTWMSGTGSAAISFDLFGANSVDGMNSYRDDFQIRLNGALIFDGSFNMSGGGANKVRTNAFGWVWNTVTNGNGEGDWFKGGVTSVSGMIDLMAGLNTLTVTFTQPGPANGAGQSIADESWALNNLQVAAVPVPAALPLMLLGLAGLGMAGRSRRKSPAA